MTKQKDNVKKLNIFTKQQIERMGRIRHQIENDHQLERVKVRAFERIKGTVYPLEYRFFRHISGIKTLCHLRKHGSPPRWGKIAMINAIKLMNSVYDLNLKID